MIPVSISPWLPGYINEGGTLHMGRFEFYLRALDDFDYSFHEERQQQQGREKASIATNEHNGRGSDEESGEDSSSPEENGADNTDETDLLGSEVAGVVATDFMSGDVCRAGEEFDETSEAAVKFKVCCVTCGFV